MAAGVAVALKLKSMWPEHARVGVDLPLGVLAVNSGSKQNVSSGLPAAGLNGGWSSLLYSFWEIQVHAYGKTNTYMLEISPYHRQFGVCEHMWNRSEDPFQINPFPIPLQPGTAKSILLALKHSRRAISVHTARTGPLPRHTHKHSWHGQDWWPVVIKPTIC